MEQFVLSCRAMDLSQIALDVPTLKLSLTIVGGLLLLSMIRIVFLLRKNERLRINAEKMEQQVLFQHQEILSVKSDSNAWRGEQQRMFDAFRAEFSKRLEESEARYLDIQKRAETLSKPARPVALSSPPLPSGTVVTRGVDADEKPVLPVPALNIS